MEEIRECLKTLSWENLVKIESWINEKKEADVFLERRIITLLQNEAMHDFYYVYLCSALLMLFPKTAYFELTLEAILLCDLYTPQQRNFLSYQMGTFRFHNPLLASGKTDELERKLQETVFQEVRRGVYTVRKEKQDRNEKNVVVITERILGEKHAPTHSTLERCHVLKKVCGMNVYIVSIGEDLALGEVPYYGARFAHRQQAYDGTHKYVYKSEEFTLHQPDRALNIVDRTRDILDYVEKVNPYYIVYVGNGSYVTDILNEFCPVVTVPIIFSTLPERETAFSMVGRQVTAEERASIKSEIIEVPFTFEITEKKRDYAREEWNIPDEAFVMAVVGNRLDSDVTDEFLERMQHVENGMLMFIGPFEQYEEKRRQFPYLVEHSVSLGKVDDVPGILECADLYVNPKRQGGGFSVIEAFHAGIPAVSITYGDVAVAAGADFCVEDYEEMIAVIERYRDDGAFYQEQCKKAEKREKEMTNGAVVFKQGIEQMLESEKFY